MDLISKALSILSPGGPISRKLEGYEVRPQQMEMARAVAEAFEGGGALVVEAGTGVGKSFAYLVPAILFSTETGEPVVISTNTINLQEQLIDKDIPFLREALPVDFTAALLKGRANYLCLRRLERLAKSEKGEFETVEEVQDFIRIREWARRTAEGTISELCPQPSESVWSKVCSQSETCLGGECKFREGCFYYRARELVSQANLIIVNHHLLLSDMVIRSVAPSGALLPDYRHLIIDEAHNLEAVATEHIGRSVSNWRVKRLLDELYNPRAGDEPKGFLVKEIPAPELYPLVEEARARAELFFELISTWIGEGDTKRIDEGSAIPNLLEEPILRIEEGLNELRERVTDQEDELELAALMRRCAELRDDLWAILSADEPGVVYWAERSVGRRVTISLNAAPISVAEELREHLFSRLRTVVATSATLAVGGSFEYFKERVGLEGARELLLGSPFDYSKQVKLFIAADLPDPREEGFVREAAEYVKRYLKLTHGKALVLFTSYRMMEEMFEILKPWLEEMGIPAMVQGEELSRSQMIERFREEVDSVIFGVASFWEGVDVQGEALSNVIIVKLPFSVPDHPVIQARLEEIERRGGNPFYEYSLPEAVLRLKQGFGRLIRTKSDAGIVAILDSRILTKSYGRVFLESLPECQVIVEGA